jgi:imidazolonepropionase-like amidohydrolase
MRNRLALTIASLTLAAASAHAAPKTTIVKAAHLFDGKSDQVVSPGVIVVQDGKIVAAGARVQ